MYFINTPYHTLIGSEIKILLYKNTFYEGGMVNDKFSQDVSEYEWFISASNSVFRCRHSKMPYIEITSKHIKLKKCVVDCVFIDCMLC